MRGSVAIMWKNVLRLGVAAFALAFIFAAQASAQSAKELTVVGRLTPTVEGGGWLIVADYGKYLILNSRAYQREPWFREGATVEATGEVKQDVVTTQMEGVPFQARTMRARGGTRRRTIRSRQAIRRRRAAVSLTMPVESGSLEIRAEVTLVAEVETKE